MNHIDIHCHLDSSDFDNDREEVLRRMKDNSIGAITIGASLEESKKAVQIAEANENIWASVGIHPDNAPQPPLNLRGGAEKSEAGVIFKFEELIQHPKVVAIGECGLDYLRLNSEKEKESQKKLFESQIQFALKHDKPLMLHVREARPTGSSGRAYDDALEILKHYKKEFGNKLRGNVHFFAGDIEIAKKFLDLGFTMSFTGVISFASDYNEVIKYIPQVSIMSETDAPWVAPVPHRGKRNEPGFVVEIVKKMAEIRGENVDILNAAIINNAQKMFGI